MSKNGKIIVSIVIVLLILAIYLVLSLKEVRVQTKVPQSSEEYAQQVQANLKKVEDQYKFDLKNVISEYEALLEDETKSVEDLSLELVKLRDRVRDLNVPAQYKEMHLNLFLAFSRIEDMGLESLGENISKISNLVGEAKAAYPWLVE